jgi:uncharacterized protein DUF3618
MGQSPGEIDQETAAAPTSDEIRSRIEQTRAEMSRTIDAIQARLSPRRIVADAKQSVKDATVGRVKRFAARAKDGVRNPAGGEPWTTERIVCVVKNNVVPVAFVGVAATAATIAIFVRSRNRVHGSDDRPQKVMQRVKSGGVGPNRTRLLSGVCVGLGCWSAWRASRLAREGTLISDVAQPM